ncbi:MAG: hypothetical protein LBS41_05565 [Streptococcaceae bacterium]|nr:hypothetical protein [Streptococcaceae bacterium]
MQEFDIIIAKVPFGDSEDYKWRPVFILSVAGQAVKFLRITTKFETKSAYMQSKYFEIIDYIEAGLNRQSWIDTFRAYPLDDINFKLHVLGRLTKRDFDRFIDFLSGTDFLIE